MHSKRLFRCKNHIHQTAAQRLVVYNNIERSFSPFNIYLWIHLIGYTEKFRYPMCEMFMKVTAISIILTIILEGLQLYVIIGKFLYRNTYSKTFYMRNIFLMCEMILRFLVIVKRRQFPILIRRLAKTYSIIVSTNNTLNFKFNLWLILLLDDFMVIAITLLGFAKITPHLLGYLGDNYYFFFIPPPYSTPVFYMHSFISNMTCLSSTIPIYFCCICYVLKNILLEFKNLIQQQRLDVAYLSGIHNKILKTISSVKKMFHSILSLTLAISLTWIFYESYILIFIKISSGYEKAYRSLYLIFYCIKFISMCVFAASITETATDIKQLISKYPLDTCPWKNIHWILSVDERFYLFVLFDKIVVDKSLILSAAAALLTYGVIFTTFYTNT